MAIDVTSPRSRRALLGAGLGAVAATVASSVARPEAADAVSYVVLGGDNSANGTTITATGPTIAFAGTNDAGVGVQGTSASDIGVNGTSSSGIGVRGFSNTDTGIYGASLSNIGVRGISTSGVGVSGFSGTGHAIFGESDHSVGVYGNAKGANTGVHGASVSGYGVYAHSGSGTALHAGSSSQSLPAVQGWSRGGSTAVLGYSGGGSLPAAPDTTGVYGDAPKGRGGQFSGGTAQLRLVPASGSHPSSGQAGDLFMDHANRLWLCKGGTSWHQLA